MPSILSVDAREKVSGDMPSEASRIMQELLRQEISNAGIASCGNFEVPKILDAESRGKF